MIKKILIANRGEIACRVIETASRMGIATVSVYSDADKCARHVKMADEAVYLGPSASKDSYLRGDLVLAKAIALGVDAIHPGYGFLSENADFAQACQDNGITFIGPPVAAIQAMGSKSAAKTIMQAANVPLVPGYHGDDQNPALIQQHAQDMGYPVLLKAAAGGGGKGMRVVLQDSEFDAALSAAKREAMSSFGDDIMLVEKYLTEPRHVEIQVFCDQHGNGVYLFERDCSVQRRHQKVIEEAPAPRLSADVRQQMGEAALKAAFAINYTGAGTVEFLFDTDGSFYFMEMNTRLQVEHPVTEMITGEDLVEWQIRVANNEVLPKTQAQLQFKGHAFEARVYAEDPANGFLPSTGTLHLLQAPALSAHVRVDTGVEQGDEVSMYYDPMIAKLIVWDENREAALNKLKKALREYAIEGVHTNIDYLHQIADSQAFSDAQLTTDFIERHAEQLIVSAPEIGRSQLALLALCALVEAPKEQANHATTAASARSLQDTWHNNDAFRLNHCHTRTLTIEVQAQSYQLTLCKLTNNSWQLSLPSISDQTMLVSGCWQNNYLHAQIDGHQHRVTAIKQDHQLSVFTPQGKLQAQVIAPDLGLADDSHHEGGVEAPMNGTVVAVLVSQGQKVNKGDSLVIVEAMKMEHTVKAPFDGVVNECYFNAGDLVSGGASLLDFSALEEGQ